MTAPCSSRRSFLAVGAAAGAAAILPASARSSSSVPVGRGSYRVPIRRALKYSMVRAEGVETVAARMALAQEAGFEGIEFDNTPLEEAEVEEILQAKEALGFEVPGLVCGAIGRKCGSLDEAERAEGVAEFAEALRHAAALGGDTVLMYPGFVDAERPYDRVYETLQTSIRELIPEAEHAGVRIACENVSNNIFISPIETRDFIDSFDSPWVGWYFDIGNIVRYGWPEQWIRILGPRILKLDIKNYDRELMMTEGVRKGATNELELGSVDWTAVMDALVEIDYQGVWASAEVRGGDLERLTEVNRAMHAVLSH